MERRIVFCNCGGKLAGSHRLNEIQDYLNQQGIPFIKISDLCGFCAMQKDEIRNLFNPDGENMIIACYPRAVKLLLNESGVDTDLRSLTYLNIREPENKAFFDQIDTFSNGADIQPATSELAANAEWLSWYPVIDYSRCSACGQCADFCLFGVYEKKDGKVLVVNPKGCKSNCPACGRICPQTAIVFPKYLQGGAIAGADSFNEIEEQQRQQQDIQSILGGDIYGSLEQRRLKRQSIIRQSEMQNALRERAKALREKGEH